METRPPLMHRFALWALLSLTACTTNHSADPKLASVMHKCFQTTDDAVLYETPFCPPQSGLSGSTTCMTIKYLNSFRPPLTLREFNSTSARVDEEVMDQLRKPVEKWQGIFGASPKDIRLVGTLVWPTSFTIEGMRRYVNYEQVDIWITTAQIRDGELAGKIITLPWEDLMQQ